MTNCRFAWQVKTLNLTYLKFTQIKKYYPSLEDAIYDSFQLLRQFDSKLYKALISKLIALNDQEYLNFNISIEKLGINIIQIDDEYYPERLQHLDQPPLVLYCQGDLNLLISKKTKVSIVGSRSIKPYSNKFLENIFSEISSNQSFLTVSGLALGVDSFVHDLSIKYQINTIAVIGSGLDNDSFYPKANLSLKKQIISNSGLVISEYPPYFRPTIFTFPQRNRIIAALSSAVFVVQASLKSGSLITASLALELGRDVCTIPANVGEIEYEGNIKLLKNGAYLIENTEDFMSICKIPFKKSEKDLNNKTIKKIKDLSFEEFTIDERLILENLKTSNLTTDLIFQKTNLNFTNLVSLLAVFEMKGLVTMSKNNEWQLNMS
jgi:DNA processing protein